MNIQRKKLLLLIALFIYSVTIPSILQAEIQVLPGYNVEIFASGIEGAVSARVNSKDELFVIENIKNRILKITPEGTVSIFAQSAPGKPLSFMSYYRNNYWSISSTRIDFDINGDLYVEACGGYNDPYNPYGDVLDTLYRITPDGTIYKVARMYFAPNVFFDIGGLAFGPAGYLYMADLAWGIIGSSYVGQDILKINLTTATSMRFSTGVIDATDLLFDNEGNLYVTMRPSGGDKDIYRFAPEGTRTVYTKAFQAPMAITWGPEGNLYVLDSATKAVYIVDPVTKAVNTFATGFHYPNDIEFDSKGNLYVVETCIDITAPTCSGQIVKISKETGGEFTNVRLIDTVPTQDVELVLSSITTTPYSITSEGDKTILEWRHDQFSVNQIETISFDLNLYNLVPGEDRLVNNKLEVIYRDSAGNDIYIYLPSLYVHVLKSAFDSAISTDKSIYQANEDASINAKITNLSEYSKTIDAKVLIEDSQGVLVKEVTTLANLNFNAGETKNFDNLIYSIGSTISGDYRAHLVLYENQQPAGEAFANFKIQPTIALTSKVMTNKISYFANEPVTITSTIQSTSTNYIFENLNAKITITNNQGAVLYNETNVIPILMPGQLTESKTYWNTSTNPPGDYPVTLEVKDSSGTVLSTSMKNITISSIINPKKLLKGQISVNKQSLLQGTPVAISYSVTNVGNIDLSQIDLSILTVHVVELTTYDTLTDQTSLQMGTTYTNTQTLSTNNYSAKDYLVILRANISGIEETLAGTYFRVEGAPSAPSLNSPEHGEDIETLTPLLSVNNASDPNDDKLTYEFELYTDNNLTNLLSSSGVIPEGGNITSWQVSLTLQENAYYYWRARAYDGLLYGEWMLPASFRVNLTNEPPTAPTLSSPADNSEVDTLTPTLTVNNASDPDSTNLTYNFELALDSNFTQIAASQIGIFESAGTTSWQVPINLNENTHYYWRAQADDWLNVGPWMETAGFFVNTGNDAPDAPVIISPANESEIVTPYTDIIASNTTDLDHDTLTYFFEIDTVNTFDSPDRKASGSIPEGTGTTSWFVDGLVENTDYYARAKASDGLAESQWSDVVWFFVNTVNEPPTAPTLANPSDGAGVNVFTPALSVHNSTDPDRDILTYKFELYGDAGMTNLVSSATGVEEGDKITSWTEPVILIENHTYYWRARAYDGELYSGWMPLASFMVNTANDAPGAPSLYFPSNGMSLDTLNPTLSIHNAEDPDSDSLTYDFEIYSNGILIQSLNDIPQDNSDITSVTVSDALTDNTTYNWRVRAYDGDRHGEWMDMATFSIHLPVTNITATIDFDPNTLNKKNNGNWVTVYIELPAGYNVNNEIISSIRLQGTIHAESWPYCIGDYDNDGIPDLMVKFKRADVINLLPDGDNVQVLVTGTVGTTTFEGVDIIRVIK